MVDRALYSDLSLTFTLGTATNPTIAQVTAWMLRLYKQAYNALGETYAAVTTHATIDTEEFKADVIADAEDIVQSWHDYLQPGEHQKKRLPIRLSQDTIDALCLRTGGNTYFMSREDDHSTKIGDGQSP